MTSEWEELRAVPSLARVVRRTGRYTLYADGIWRDRDGAYIAAVQPPGVTGGTGKARS